MEIWTPNDFCSLDSHTVVVAEMSTSRSHQKLRVRHAIDLTGLKIGQRQHIGLIVNKQFPNGEAGIVPKGTKHWRSYSSVELTEENWLKLQKEETFLVLLLLYSKTQKVFDVFKLKPRHRHVIIEEDETKFIQNSLIDHLVITGPQGPQSCKIVNEVLGTMKPKVAPFDKFIIEHHRSQQFNKDLSVNRCDSLKPYDLRSFKHGEATPGRENDCPQTSGKFVKDDHNEAVIDEMEIDVPADVPVIVQGIQPEGACEDPVAKAAKTSTVNVKIQQEYDGPQPCFSEDVATQRLGPARVKYNHRMGRKRKLMNAPFLRENWRDKSRYKALWSKQMNQHQKHLIDSQVAEDNGDWFLYKFNARNPEKSTFGCDPCTKFRPLTYFRESFYSKFSTEEGVLYTTKAENHRAIKSHASSALHGRTIELALEHQLDKMDDETIKHLKAHENPILKATNNLIEMVIQESKMNIPNNKHPMMWEYMDRKGVDVGKNHCKSRKVQRKVMLSVSDTMHKKFVKYLKEHPEEPIAMVLDGSEDVSKTHLITVHLYTFEDLNPICIFYSLLPTGSKATGKKIHDVVKESFEEAGLWDLIKKSLVAVVSDGDNTMIGQKKGFATLLKESLSNNFIVHWCLDHRIDLIFKNPMKEYPEFFAALKSAMNEMASFYSRSWKKTADLIEYCKAKGYEIFTLPHTHDVRWVKSYHRVVETIMKNWLALLEHVETIASNMKKEYDKVSVKNAKKHLSFLRDKFAMLGLAVVGDFTNRFTVDSMTFQRKFGTLIGQADRERKLVTDLKKIANGEGKNTQDFLAKSVCYKNPNKSDKKQCTSIQMYEESFVEYKGVELLDMGSEGIPRLSSFLNKYLEEVLKTIENYFPHTYSRKTNPAKLNMEIFSPFNQELWQWQGNLAVGSIKEAAKAVNIEYTIALQNEFEKLVQTMKMNIMYCMNKKSDPFYFWLSVLKDFGSNMSPKLRQLIKSIIIIPWSSAEAERAFSLMNFLKTKLRNRMGHDSLQAHMRVAINSPKIMDASEYTVEYLKKNDPCDQSSTQPHFAFEEEFEEDVYSDELEEFDRFEDILLTGKASFY